MTLQTIAAYSFLPWAKQGLGVHLRQGAAGDLRGVIDVNLQIVAERIEGGQATEPVPKAVQLYGPGDVIGVESRAIVRTEPRDYITNFETNYLPFVEFYDEDFPWRYTPTPPSPNGARLQPWLALAVLEESEFDPGGNIAGRPLAYITLKAAPANLLPPLDQLWAWAHVHVNGGLGSYADSRDALAGKLDAAVTADRDSAYSRLLCPRILKSNTAYHAFLIPSYETGRLAGLGKDPALAGTAGRGAWESYAGQETPNEIPYYHRWYFRTGLVGDFEYLVRLLQPRTVDPRVGRRDIDVQAPAPNLGLPGIPELGGILRLGGALRAPLATLSDDDRAEYDRHEHWGAPYPHAFQTALAAIANLNAEYAGEAALPANNAAAQAVGDAGGDALMEDDEDPWIVPPIYGRWHADTDHLIPANGDPARRHWVHELNLDPRHRAAAGFGTQVVQKYQENYMEDAWKQVGKVLEGNARIRYGQMAKFATLIWHNRELAAIQASSPERYLAIAAPVQRRVLAEGLTVHHQVQASALPPALTSKVFRQALRPNGRISRRAGFDIQRSPSNLLERANRGEVSAAPPVVISTALPTGEKLAGRLPQPQLPAGWLEAVERRPWLRYLPLALALLLALILFFVSSLLGVVVGTALIGAAVWILRATDRDLRRRQALRGLSPDSRTPDGIDRLPKSPDFRIGIPGRAAVPSIGGTDSPEATRFKSALRNLYTVDAAERAIPVVERRPLAIQAIAQASLDALHPTLTVQTRVLGPIHIPSHIRDRLRDPFGEIMVYPEIDLPMYAPLKELSSEMFLPNIQLIENNSITLLETNQKFIEAYMVGLNHEMARELLWREYPTDQLGSYFRQFWDVTGYLVGAGTDRQVRRERLYDIPELHTWDPNTGLGEHDHREIQGDKEDEVTLVIRGELLKKYPTAVIYAHRAEWELLDGRPDKTRARKMVALTPAQEANPPRSLVKTPLYEARVDPDIYFFGFDLTAEDARGGKIVDGVEDPGWFFVIKERPGEPRFGLDLPKDGPQATISTWNDLAWTDVLADYANSAFLRIGERSVTLTNPNASGGLQDQYTEDSRFRWRADTHAAELAYILYQVPVLMAVHAAEMLVKVA